MALVLADRVKETTTSTGTTAITLAGAATGYQSFSAAVGNGNSTYYTIADQGGADWEVGIGTYTSSGASLSRGTVLSSSNGGALVNFTAGTKDVFVTYPSGKAFWLSDVPLYTANGGNGISSALSITAVNALFTPFYLRASPRYTEINGNLTSPNLSGKWIEGINYTNDTTVTSLTYSDLAGVVGIFAPATMAALTTLSLPALTTVGSTFAPATMAALTTLSLPALTTVGNNFAPATMGALTTLSLPALTTVGGLFNPNSMAALTTLSLPALTTVVGSFNPSTMGALTTLSLPALTSIGNSFILSTMGALTSISAPVLTTISVSFNPTSIGALTSLSLPALTTVGSNFSLNNTPVLTTLSLPALTTVRGSFNISTMPALTTLSLPALTIVPTFNPLGLGALTTLSLPALTTVLNLFNPASMAALTSITLPVIARVGTITISSGMAALNTFTLGSTLKSVGGNVTITSAALTQGSVDSILVRLAALDGTNGTTAYSSKTVTITGTSATPSATGLAAKAVLVARGCTVTTN